MKVQDSFESLRNYLNNKHSYQSKHIIGCLIETKEFSVFTSNKTISEFRNTTFHAEARAISSTTSKIARNSVIFVARITKHGTFRLALPCKACRKRIEEACIKKAYFTVSDTEYGIWNINSGIISIRNL